jgi:hypothetical protein
METVSLKEQGSGDLIPQETLDAIIHSIAERFSPRKIMLFGSY